MSFVDFSKLTGQALADKMTENCSSFTNFRLRHPDWIPDLRGARLAGHFGALIEVDLNSALLTEVTMIRGLCLLSNFDFAEMSGSKFHGVNLSGSSLKGITAVETDFSGSILETANLEIADMRNAILVGARIFEAKFTGANLRGANFTGVIDFHLADFECCDTSGIITSNHVACLRH